MHEAIFPLAFGNIPWSAIAPHEDQAKKNHGLSLKRLAERGGLDLLSAVAIMSDLRWVDVKHLTREQAWARLHELVRIEGKAHVQN